MTTYSRARDEYLESEVLTAGPVRRVQILYEAAIEAVAKAKAAQSSGDLAARARQVNRATAILVELAVSLDHSKGGQLSRELAELYDYSMRRLMEGSIAKKAAPFAEVERLLRTLLEGWKEVPELDGPAGTHQTRSGDSFEKSESPELVGAGVDQVY